jgi:hypothetical protein
MIYLLHSSSLEAVVEVFKSVEVEEAVDTVKFLLFLLVETREE